MYTHRDDALQAIKSLAFQRTPLNLFCSFKGVHFSEKIQPLQVGIDHVTFKMPAMNICLILRDPVYLNSRVLPEAVKASPQMMSCTTPELRLSNFSYTGTLWFDRLEQRVQPERPVSVGLSIHKKNYNATLKDISAHGAGLLVYVGENPDLDVLTNTPVDLRFQLTPTTRLSLPGKVICRKRYGRGMLSLGVRIFPTQSQEGWLTTYTNRRRAEILNELQQQLNNTLEPQRVKDLYF